MELIQEQLEQLARLCIRLNHSSPEDKLNLTNALLDKEPSQVRFPQVKLRWLVFKLKRAEEKNAPTSDIKEIAYLKKVAHCEAFTNFETMVKPEDNTEDIEQLKQLIEKQKQIIFISKLEEAIRSELHSYHKALTAPPKDIEPFAKDRVLKKALKQYQRIIYKESLQQFEILCLIHRLHLLDVKKKFESAHPSEGMMTVNLSINPELRFIQEQLDIQTQDQFRLQKTEKLYSETAYSDNIVEQLNSFFNLEGNNNIDSRISSASYGGEVSNNIKSRAVNLYLNNPEFLQCPIYMGQVLSEVDNFRKITTEQHNEYSKPQNYMVLVFDEKQQRLRKVIKEYDAVLDQIVAKEQAHYQNRNPEALENRVRALKELKEIIDAETPLNQNSVKKVSSLIGEIQHNQPTWKELSLIDKLLDILSFGYRALNRNSLFKSQPESVQLHREKDNPDIHY